jgi:hypothetical protein
MFCTSCGTEVDDDSIHCTACGVGLSEAGINELPEFANDEATLPKGCLVLFFSIFTMPIKTARVAASELRRIGRAGSLDTENDFPHLTWLRAVLPVIATALSIGIVSFGFYRLLFGDAEGSNKIIGFFAALLIAIVADWLIMLIGEASSAYIVSAQYYSKKLRKDD